jgi:hypothetical protein
MYRISQNPKALNARVAFHRSAIDLDSPRGEATVIPDVNAVPNADPLPTFWKMIEVDASPQQGQN